MVWGELEINSRTTLTFILVKAFSHAPPKLLTPQDSPNSRRKLKVGVERLKKAGDLKALPRISSLLSLGFYLSAIANHANSS